MLKLSVTSFRALIIAFVLSFLLMWLSPVIVGTIEPWDANGIKFLLYLLQLFLIGVISTALSKYSYLSSAFGAFLGQLVYVIIILGSGPLVILGALYIGLFSVSTLAGGYCFFWYNQR